MNDFEILANAMKIALKNGLNDDAIKLRYYEIAKRLCGTIPSIETLISKPPKLLFRFTISEEEQFPIIFNHKFARAFWHHKKYKRTKTDKDCWQFHLQQMVLMKKPLDYMKEYLN